MIVPEIQQVQLSEIDRDDTSFVLTPWAETCSDELKESIREFGILRPPLLQRITSGKYRIIAGHKRIAAAQTLSPASPLPALIVQKELPEPDLLTLLFEETITGVPFSPVEQIFFFARLCQSDEPVEKLLPFLQRLGYKPVEHVLLELLQLKSLCMPGLQALHRQSIGVKTARKLLRFSVPDQELLVSLISSLKLGVSKQQKLLDQTWELSIRGDVSAGEILSAFPTLAEWEQPNNIPQYGTALLTWLHEQCFPQLAEAEDIFRQQVARLDLPKSMQASHTPAFENDEIFLTVRLPGLEQLSDIAPGLCTLLSRK